MIKKIDHIVITTNDIEKCINFYKKIGFISKFYNERYELYSGDFKINVHIKNHELSPHAQYIQTGSADLCFEITDTIKEFKKKLELEGLIIELGIVKKLGVNGNMNSFYLRDPDGNLLGGKLKQKIQIKLKYYNAKKDIITRKRSLLLWKNIN